jgi:RNA polymerase sigma factor (sigma-70 family)
MTGESFQKAIGKLRQKMLATAQRYFTDGRAEDMVQDALLRMWEMRETLTEPIDGIASVLVRNISVDCLRREKPTVNIETCDVEESPDSSSDQRYARIMTIIDRLPLQQQTLIRLRLIDEMEYSEISKLTGMKEPAVRQAISRARLAIRQQYIKEANEDK